MWRRNFDEDWERKRALMIRSLFHDIPVLSPVPEEEESFDSNRSHIHRTPPEAPERPYSPLPPLNIEVETITNRHDEPEEYYKKLGKRMRKAYRKLFIEGRSDIDTTTLDSSEEEDELNLQSIGNMEKTNDDKSIGDENLDTTVDLQISNESQSSEGQGRKRVHKHPIEDDSTTNDSSKSKRSKSMIHDVVVDLDNNSNTDNTSENTPSEMYNARKLRSSTPNDTVNNETGIYNSDTSSLTDHSTGCRQVTFQADVHRENDDGFVKPCAVHEEIGDDLEAGDENLEILEQNIDSDNSNQCSRESAAPQEIELMRTPRIHPSTGSLHPFHDDSHYEEIAAEQEPRELEVLTQSSSLDKSNSNSVDSEPNFELLSRGTRVSDKNRDNAVLPNSRRSSSSSVSSERTRYEDVGLQTSFDYDEENDNLNNIFVGVPKVYRLCSCVDHTCGC